jgi:hypothetical protein
VVSIEPLAAVIVTSVVFSAAVPRVPRLFAPLAFLPVGVPVTLAIPAGAAAAWRVRQQRSATYRTMETAPLDLSAMPGESRVERDDFRLTFFPERGFAAAATRGFRAASIVRVDVRFVEGTLVLRSRQLPSFIVWLPTMIVVFSTWAFTAQNAAVGLGCAAGLVMGLWRQLEEARDCVAAVASELKSRLGQLASDSPGAASG